MNDSQYVYILPGKERKNEGGKIARTKEKGNHLFLETGNLMSNISKILNIRFLSIPILGWSYSYG